MTGQQLIPTVRLRHAPPHAAAKPPMPVRCTTRRVPLWQATAEMVLRFVAEHRQAVRARPHGQLNRALPPPRAPLPRHANRLPNALLGVPTHAKPDLWHRLPHHRLPPRAHRVAMQPAHRAVAQPVLPAVRHPLPQRVRLPHPLRRELTVHLRRRAITRFAPPAAVHRVQEAVLHAR